MKKDSHWSESLQMTYDYRDGVLIFTDGVKYTVHEAVILSKGKLNNNDLRAIHHVKKAFDGEIEDHFGRVRFNPMPCDLGKMPEKIPVSPVRPVLQECWGRRKKREKRFVNPDQGVLNL